MVSKNMKIVAVCAMVVVIIGAYCAYASNHAFDAKGEPSTVSFEMNVGEKVLNTTLETYVGGDPTRMIEFTLINPNVERIYILFRASEVETDNPSLLKASASVGEGLGAAIGKRRLNITPENILPREISWFHRVLIYSGFMGTESEPVIYFKTPNVGGTEDRIIVMNGIIIIESSTFENSYLLGSFIRQLVMK